MYRADRYIINTTEYITKVSQQVTLSRLVCEDKSTRGLGDEWATSTSSRQYKHLCLLLFLPPVSHCSNWLRPPGKHPLHNLLPGVLSHCSEHGTNMIRDSYLGQCLSVSHPPDFQMQSMHSKTPTLRSCSGLSKNTSPYSHMVPNHSNSRQWSLKSNARMYWFMLWLDLENWEFLLAHTYWSQTRVKWPYSCCCLLCSTTNRWVSQQSVCSTHILIICIGAHSL